MMHKFAILAAIGGTAVLSGCATGPLPGTANPASVADVLKQIKSELVVYKQYETWSDGQPALPDACGGRVSFEIKSVKVTLTTQQNASVGGSGSGTIPSLPLVPSLTLSNETRGAQTLTFVLYPKPDDRALMRAAEAPRRPDARSDVKDHPVAAAIEGLREALLATSAMEPCISLTAPGAADGQGGNTYQIGFTVINTVSGGISTPKILPFSLGVSTSQQIQAANTITVTFAARKGSAALAQ